MLKSNRVSIVLAAAALIIVPTLLTAPASAQTKVYLVAQNSPDNDHNRDRNGRGDSRQNSNSGDRGNWNRDGRGNWNRDGRSNSRQIGDSNRGNWNRDNQYNGRGARLRNGDIRLGNGRIIPARDVVRLRNGYSRLPDGVIIGPHLEFYAPGYVIPVRPPLIQINL